MNKVTKLQKLFMESQDFITALGDPVRQELLLHMLGDELLSVKELTARTNLSRPTISHHLRILKDAGIVGEFKEGRETYYHPQPGEHYATIKELIKTIDKAVSKWEAEQKAR